MTTSASARVDTVRVPSGDSPMPRVNGIVAFDVAATPARGPLG